jgi:hypothetical protein
VIPSEVKNDVHDEGKGGVNTQRRVALGRISACRRRLRRTLGRHGTTRGRARFRFEDCPSLISTVVKADCHCFPDIG